jgi:peptidoglycan/LPS O-acetylase OafA/YrhL
MLFYLIFTVGLFLIRRTGILLIPAALLGVVAAGEAVMPLSAIAEPMTLAQYWTRPILLLFPVGALPRLNVQNVSPVLFVAAALVESNVFGLAIYRLVEMPILRTFRGMSPTFRPGSSVRRRPPAAPR